MHLEMKLLYCKHNPQCEVATVVRLATRSLGVLVPRVAIHLDLMPQIGQSAWRMQMATVKHTSCLTLKVLNF